MRAHMHRDIATSAKGGIAVDEWGYPGLKDEAVAQYWSLDPLRFTDLERFELQQPSPWSEDSEVTLRVVLVADDIPDQVLSIEFEGIEELQLNTSGQMHLYDLTIISIADRGWQDAKYSVETEVQPDLKFYCRKFTAALLLRDK